METVLPKIEWTAIEYAHTPKRSDWFWAVGITGFSLGALAIVFHNFLFGVFILIATTILIILNVRRPATITCAITEKEIKVNAQIIPLAEIKAFSFRGEPGHRALLIERRRAFMPHETIAIADALEVGIKTTLSKKVKYDENLEEPAVYRILEKFDL